MNEPRGWDAAPLTKNANSVQRSRRSSLWDVFSIKAPRYRPKYRAAFW